MKTIRKRGTVLTLVIVALSFMAGVMFVLVEGANTMLFQADGAYCRAVERNLTASALAWARSRAAQGAAVTPGDPVTLDTRALGGERVALRAQLTQIAGTTANVRIQTSCSKGRQTLQESREYAVSRP